MHACMGDAACMKMQVKLLHPPTTTGASTGSTETHLRVEARASRFFTTPFGGSFGKIARKRLVDHGIAYHGRTRKKFLRSAFERTDHPPKPYPSPTLMISTFCTAVHAPSGAYCGRWELLLNYYNSVSTLDLIHLILGEWYLHTTLDCFRWGILILLWEQYREMSHTARMPQGPNTPRASEKPLYVDIICDYVFM